MNYNLITNYYQTRTRTKLLMQLNKKRCYNKKAEEKEEEENEKIDA
jgi:hypothetical protein